MFVYASYSASPQSDWSAVLERARLPDSVGNGTNRVGAQWDNY